MTGWSTAHSACCARSIRARSSRAGSTRATPPTWSLPATSRARAGPCRRSKASTRSSRAANRAGGSCSSPTWIRPSSARNASTSWRIMRASRTASRGSPARRCAARSIFRALCGSGFGCSPASTNAISDAASTSALASPRARRPWCRRCAPAARAVCSCRAGSCPSPSPWRRPSGSTGSKRIGWYSPAGS